MGDVLNCNFNCHDLDILGFYLFIYLKSRHYVLYCDIIIFYFHSDFSWMFLHNDLDVWV